MRPGDNLVQLQQRTRLPLEAIPQQQSVPLQQAIPADAGLRAPTFADKVREYRDAAGRMLAPILGLNFDQQAADEAAGIQRQMLVYHGSPHTFDQFDISKVGTGEGGAAYGHGLYMAENPQVAHAYQKNLSDLFPGGVRPEPGSIEGRAATYVADAMSQQSSNPYGHAASMIRKLEPRADVEPMLEALAKWEGSNTPWKYGGGLYSAEFPDRLVPKTLDWDKSIAEQSPEVRKALQPFIQDMRTRAAESHPDWGDLADPNKIEHLTTGGDLYRQLAQQHGKDKASQMLNSMGVPGIQFLDKGSRSVGAGTRNFVVFDPNILTDTRRGLEMSPEGAVMMPKGKGAKFVKGPETMGRGPVVKPPAAPPGPPQYLDPNVSPSLFHAMATANPLIPPLPAAPGSYMIRGGKLVPVK